MKKLKVFEVGTEYLMLDVELSSHCNTNCFFCPRDAVPFEANMSSEVYAALLERAAELPQRPPIMFCGTGDASMHPDLVDYVRQSCDAGFKTGLTTNGYLVDSEKSIGLLEAGLSSIYFSVNGLFKSYEEIYKFAFEDVVKNIEQFKFISRGRCDIKISAIRDIFSPRRREEIVSFWEDRGIEVVFFAYTNRTGLVRDLEDLHLEGSPEESLCPIPFRPIHIGVNGSYYLCSHDFSRRIDFGNVKTHTIKESLLAKLDYFKGERRICRNCCFETNNYFDGNPPRDLLMKSREQIINMVEIEL